MVSVCLPSDALLQQLPSYLGFSYLGCRVSLHGYSSKVQPLLLTLNEGYFLTTALPDLQRGIAPLGPLVPEKARDFQKNICFCFIDYAKAFDCVDHHKLWKILKEMDMPDYLTCLLRNLYAGQEATDKTEHGITDWFQIGKGVRQGCILSPCLFNLYAEYIMRNAGLDEA